MGQQRAGRMPTGVVVVRQPVVDRLPAHRPHNGGVLRQGVGDKAVTLRQVADRNLLRKGVVAWRRLEDAVLLAVRP